MKKIFRMIRERGIINILTLFLVVESADATCIWTLHQPKFPKSANKYRKYKETHINNVSR